MDYEKAASYWEEKESREAGMEREELLRAAESFIEARNTCALATGSGEFVRCTPIEYSYMDGCFWMLSEGGEKFRALEKNKNVCLAIFDPYTGFGKLGGMQVSGRAELVEPWSEEYLRLLEYKKLPAEGLKKLPRPMYLIKVLPRRIDMLSSEFKSRGFAPRQHIDL